MLTDDVQTAVPGEEVHGIPILEENRATVFEYRPREVEVLAKIAWENYLSKGVRAVLVKQRTMQVGENRPFKYAVYVQPGFLMDVGEEL